MQTPAPTPSLVYRTCKICNATGDANQYKIREMMYGSREEFPYFECASCGCLQIDEIPADMSKHYPQKYYSFKRYAGKSFKGMRGSFKKWVFEGSLFKPAWMRSLLANLFPNYRFTTLKQIRMRKDMRILEIGCGNGDRYLYPLAEIGFKNLLGCDPYLSETIHYDNGLTIRKDDVLGVTGAWDLIIYHYVFEHVSNQMENLVQVQKLLSADGICIIGIPTVSSYAWRHFGTNWYQLDAPRHFFIHSIKSMEGLASRADLKVLRTMYESEYKQFIISEEYACDIPMNAPKPGGLLARINRRLVKLKYNRLARELDRQGEGDLVHFYLARK